MKAIRYNLLVLLTLLLFQHPAAGQSSMPGPASGTDVKVWMEQHFAKGQTPPFSFVYGGKRSANFLKNWQYKAEKLSSTAEHEEVYAYTYSDKSTGLTVTCTVTCFTDFPAIEWVLNFTNTSGKNTPLIEQVEAIDQAFMTTGEGPVILHHARGSDAGRDDFGPIDEEMETGKTISIIQDKGRSSSHSALPFFNIEMSKNDGFVVAIGWTGTWQADISHPKAKTVSLQSGMRRMKLVLYPEEHIRTLRICLLFWQGEDRMVGHNSFRQFVLKHHSRKINGQFAEYPLSAGFSFGDPQPMSEYECLTESYALALVDRYRQFNLTPEIFWLDAGWYEGCRWDKTEDGTWWENVGTWSAAKERFPNGLRPVADAIHAMGSKFMVWFEPERAYKGSYIYENHPDWLLKREWYGSTLVDLGNPEALAWLIDYMGDFLEKEGIDYYRQDFNIDPMPYWEVTDTPGRVGMTEIKHIEGLYKYWDSLLERFPNLLIDNCAGGGRRLDLETISRSAPLWRTDYQYGEPNGAQCHTYSLNFYLPIHGTGIGTTDDFTFRSALSAAAQGGWLNGRGKETIEINRKYMEEFRELRPYYYGDYYPLTSTQNYTRNSVWLAYQMNRPQEKDGIIIAFRRMDNDQPTISVQLKGLDKDATYEVYYEEYGLRTTYKGSELMDNLELTIRHKPGSLLIRYKKVS